MGNLIITQGLKDANEGKLDNYEVGQEVEIDDVQSFDEECKGPCAGHWIKVGGICVCDPAPDR